MTDLSSIIGPQLAGDLYRHQATDVEAACIENEAGVRRIAAQVLADRTVTNPTAAFLSRLKRGQHRQAPRPAANTAASKLSALERAELAYHAKIAHLNEHGALGNGWSQADAIAYAIDYTKGATDETEAALRERLGLPAYISSPAPINWEGILKTLAGGDTKPRPASEPAGLSDETTSDLLDDLA